VKIDDATKYSAEDSDVAFRLSEILEKEIAQENMTTLYYGLELPLEEVLMRMEMSGMRVDEELLSKMHQEFESKIEKLEKEAYELAGQEFNLASPKQVSDILFGKLQLESVKKTKTGQSTDSGVLEVLAHVHPLPKLLLEHRMLSKLLGTYVDALPKLINPQTGRVHTSFNQAVTGTGRLSSSDPNLQNIPIRSQEGRRIREAFIAEEGCVLISLDYSQIELRLLAQVSQDPVMLDAFNKGEDIHQRTASEIFDVKLSDVTKGQRAIAKTINFGLMYGMGVHRLSQTLGITRKEASEYLNRYYDRYAGIFEWQKECLKRAHEDKEVKTLMGRRRKLQEIDSKNRMLVQRAERVAINTPIQGTAADMIKMAMIQVDRMLLQEFPKAKMVLQVHDELIIEAPQKDALEVEKRVKDIMCHAMDLAVPIIVDSGIGESWAKAH